MKLIKFLKVAFAGCVAFMSLLSGNLAKAQVREITCPDTVLINAIISAYGFDYRDLDSVLVKMYKKNTGFRRATDSFYVVNRDIIADSVQRLRYINIPETHSVYNYQDWSFELRGHKLYKVSDVETDIVIERHQFKRCRMVRYKLNGKVYSAQQVEIVKPGFKKVKVKKPAPQKGKQRLIL